MVARRLGPPQPLAGGRPAAGRHRRWRRPSPLALEAATAVLAEVRRAKTAARRVAAHPGPAGSRSPTGPSAWPVLAEVAGDLRRAGAVADLVLLDPADTLTVTVDLAGG